MENAPSEEELGLDVYISSLSPEAKELLDALRQSALEIEDPNVSEGTYIEVSLRIGMLMGSHAELGRIPPNVLLRYLGFTPTGLAERGWIERQASLDEDTE